MKAEFVMFHCYNKKKNFHDAKDCTGSFGMTVTRGLDSESLLSLCYKYIPCSTVYIKFNRTSVDFGSVDTSIELEEMKNEF